MNYTIHIKGNKTEFREIKVTYEGLGKIGYVANSSYTVIGESMSAGRLDYPVIDMEEVVEI